MDPYEVLGVDKDASPEDIRRAYHRLAKELHPDRNPDGAEQFKRVTEAYAMLAKPQASHFADDADLDDGVIDFLLAYQTILRDAHTLRGSEDTVSGVATIPSGLLVVVCLTAQDLAMYPIVPGDPDLTVQAKVVFLGERILNVSYGATSLSIEIDYLDDDETVVHPYMEFVSDDTYTKIADRLRTITKSEPSPSPQPSGKSAGWYEQPSRPGYQMWWNGTEWVQNRTRKTPTGSRSNQQTKTPPNQSGDTNYRNRHTTRDHAARTQPGWYDNPHQPGTQMWWNGTEWNTQRTRTTPSGRSNPHPQSTNRNGSTPPYTQTAGGVAGWRDHPEVQGFQMWWTGTEWMKDRIRRKRGGIGLDRGAIFFVLGSLILIAALLIIADLGGSTRNFRPQKEESENTGYLGTCWAPAATGGTAMKRKPCTSTLATDKVVAVRASANMCPAQAPTYMETEDGQILCLQPLTNLSDVIAGKTE